MNFIFKLSLQRILTVLILLFFAATMAVCQTTTNPFEPGTTVEQVFSWYQALYMAVITVITYLQGTFFKKSTWIPNTAVRYVLIAVVAGALFIGLGWANALSIFIGFIGAALTYDKVLKPFGLVTPKPTL